MNILVRSLFQGSRVLLAQIRPGRSLKGEGPKFEGSSLSRAMILINQHRFTPLPCNASPEASGQLAWISAVLVSPLFWPVGVYAWWFMHSEGAK